MKYKVDKQKDLIYAGKIIEEFGFFGDSKKTEKLLRGKVQIRNEIQKGKEKAKKLAIKNNCLYIPEDKLNNSYSETMGNVFNV